MATWQLAIAALTILIAGTGLLWSIARLRKDNQPVKTEAPSLSEIAEKSAANIFDDQFREQLRNRGRLYFEKIISENAMFLQQDLRLTTSQLNDYMKDEIKRTLKEEFAKYEESITTAKDLALETIQKTQTEIEQQRQMISKQMAIEVATEKQRILTNFEKNMADIVNHYILAAIGNEVDLTAQLDFIFQRLEENKAAILEDIRSGT
jgi:hypothetical protein